MAHYSKAPITEALIDLRVQLPPGASLANLEKVCTNEAERYPDKRKQFSFSAQVQGGQKVSANAAQQELGWLIHSHDKKHVCQVQLTGFTFSRLAPYDRWESLRTEAQRLWRLYKEVTSPIAVTRVAVRYINRLDLPLPLRDFKDYLQTVPEVSPAMPQGLSGFFMQLQVPQADLPGMLILTEALIPPPSKSVVSVVLDIDLYRDQDLPQKEDDIWDLLEQLHVRKNEIFEGCITDRTREIIR